MNLSDILIISSIITGLISIPFLTSTLTNDYIPTGSLLLNLNESEVKEIPGITSSFYGPEKLEREMQTPFGRFKFSIMADGISQELARPDRKVTVVETPDYTTWVLQTQELMLNITRTSTRTIEKCETHDGWIEMIRESGTTGETYYGQGFESLNETCKQAEKVLQSEVERMEGMKKQMLGIPEEIVINEFVINTTNGNYECQWIELYNREVYDVSLDGWSIELYKKPGELSGTINLTGSIGTQNFTVINCSGIRMYKSKGMLVLKKAEKMVDTVAYGDFDDGSIVDNAPKINKEKSISRCPDGKDTNDDSNDFILLDIPTSGSKNECP